MPKLVFVELNPRGDHSIPRHMTRRVVTDGEPAQGEDELVRDHAETELPFVTAQRLQACFTAAEQHSAENIPTLRLSDELVDELLDPKQIGTATPVHNDNIPAALKDCGEDIVRKALTHCMDGGGFFPDKKAAVPLASGDIYTQGSPIRDRNAAAECHRPILGVIGIGGATFVADAGDKVVNLGVHTTDGFIKTLEPEIARAAA